MHLCKLVDHGPWSTSSGGRNRATNNRKERDDEKERNEHMMRILQGSELVGRRGNVKDSGKDVRCYSNSPRTQSKIKIFPLALYPLSPPV